MGQVDYEVIVMKISVNYTLNSISKQEKGEKMKPEIKEETK
tara:strand:- start:1066 stop:1188 length:123 start_codon:yes stop_codon:yes gene_type:complete